MRLRIGHDLNKRQCRLKEPHSFHFISFRLTEDELLTFADWESIEVKRKRINRYITWCSRVLDEEKFTGLIGWGMLRNVLHRLKAIKQQVTVWAVEGENRKQAPEFSIKR